MEHITSALSSFVLTPCAIAAWTASDASNGAQISGEFSGLLWGEDAASMPGGRLGAVVLVSALEFGGLALQTMGYQMVESTAAASVMNYLEIPYVFLLQVASPRILIWRWDTMGPVTALTTISADPPPSMRVGPTLIAACAAEHATHFLRQVVFFQESVGLLKLVGVVLILVGGAANTMHEPIVASLARLRLRWSAWARVQSE